MKFSYNRASAVEQERTRDLVALMPAVGGTALDVGANDGHFSLILAERFDKVIALDLEKPAISHPKVVCVQGNAAQLELPDDSIDFVFCAEVLEHIPSAVLEAVCRELERVCKGKLLVGVPYRQDLRVGRTTCYSCMGKNPPWGHVNSFDEHRLARLFAQCAIEETRFVGLSAAHTNALSCSLMDLAGNPYGTYSQEESCIHCGRALVQPPERNLVQKALTKLAVLAQSATGLFVKPHANWMHMLLAKKSRA